MRKSLFLLVIFASLLLILAAQAVFAQVKALPSDYNWCSDPAFWRNGQCDYPDNPQIEMCHWEVGWYLPRLLNGEFSPNDIQSACVRAVLFKPLTQSNDDCSGYFIVVLQGSPYVGGRNLEVSGDNYSGSLFILGNFCGLIIHGNNNNNAITGSMGDDQIFGYNGNDDLIGDGIFLSGAGDDVIYGGDGDDFIAGDTVFGNGSGADILDGGDGDDAIYGDSLFGGGTGNDVIYGGNGDDLLTGDSNLGPATGDDKIDGGAGNDTLLGAGNTNDITTNTETNLSSPDN